MKEKSWKKDLHFQVPFIIHPDITKPPPIFLISSGPFRAYREGNSIRIVKFGVESSNELIVENFNQDFDIHISSHSVIHRYFYFNESIPNNESTVVHVTDTKVKKYFAEYLKKQCRPALWKE